MENVITSDRNKYNSLEELNKGQEYQIYNKSK